MHIMVLNDGETFTDVKGCKIVYVSDTLPPGVEVEDVLGNLQFAQDQGDAEIITEFK